MSSCPEGREENVGGSPVTSKLNIEEVEVVIGCRVSVLYLQGWVCPHLQEDGFVVGFWETATVGEGNTAIVDDGALQGDEVQVVD